MGASSELRLPPFLNLGAALALGLGLGCLRSVPVVLPDSGVCTFGSIGFSPGARDPENPCRSCQPSVSTSAFSPVDEGKSCGDGGAGFCHTGVCSPGCFTAGAFHFAGDPGGGPCQRCDPSRDPNGWIRATGAALPLECASAQVCSSGACITGCFVDGLAVVDGVIEPANPCERCQASLTTSSWSPVAEGTPCGDGGQCAAGVCELGCRIGDALYPAGTPDPSDACRSCQPALDAIGWSPLSGLPPYACDGGQVCDQGACTHGCWIGGAFVAPGSAKPGLPCQVCLPQFEVTDFSPLSGDALGACGPGAVCERGACLTGCFIDGGGYQTAGSFQSGNNALCCGPSNSTQNWSPTFVQAATFVGSGTTLVAGDIDGDGFTDVVAGDVNNGIEVFFADGVGGLRQPVPALPNPSSGFNYGPTVALGDLDGDGLLELVAAVALDGGNYGLAVFALLDGGFTLAATYQRTSWLSALALGDFNGDGHLDVAIADSFGVQIFINQGDGGLVPGAMLTAPVLDGVGPIVAADFNGDGKVDLALVISYRPSPVFWFGDGDGGFPASSQLTQDHSQVNAAVGVDLEGTGRADLVVGSSDDHLIRIFSVAPDGSTRISSDLMPQTYALAYGDLNGDGWPDLIASDANGANLELMINSDAGFLSNASASLPLDPSSFASRASVVVGRFEPDAGLGLAILSYGPVTDGGLSLYRSGCR